MGTHPYLTLTDGTTTITIANGLGTNTNWSLVRGSWEPAVSVRQMGQLGDRFVPVVESFQLNIRGTTVADAYTNVQTLQNLLDKAQRWALGETGVSAVKIVYAPKGGTSDSTNPYEALIVGADGEKPMVILDSRTYDAGLLSVILGVTVRFVRRGLWTRQTATTATSGSVTAGQVWSVTMGATHPIPSPIDITYTLPTTSNTLGDAYITQDQVIVTAASSSDIAVIDSASMTINTGGTVVTSNALGGSVINGGGGSTVDVTIPFSSIGLLQTAGQYLVIMSGYLNNTSVATLTWSQQWNAFNTATYTETLQATVPANSLAAQAVVLGVITVANSNSIDHLDLTLVDTLTVTNSIDYVVLVRITDATRVLRIAPIPIEASSLSWGASSVVYAAIKCRVTSAWEPIHRCYNGAGTLNVSNDMRGDAVVMMTGTTLAGVWLCTNTTGGTGGTGGSYRVAQQPASSAAHSTTFTVDRYRGALIPD